MEILVFLIVATIGLTTTRLLLKIYSQQDDFSRHKQALVFAFGLGLTWFFSFLTTIAVANNFQIEISLVHFILATTLLNWILAYVISYFIPVIKKKPPGSN